jgi:AcrR family transcriptional regulator
MRQDDPWWGRVAAARAASPAQQRSRLIDAFTKIASERGYTRIGAAEVAAEAGLPDETFYEHFADLPRCLVASYDAYFERLMAHIEEACEGAEEWPDRVKAAVRASLEFVLETASRARFFSVEAIGAGPALLERRFASTTRLAARLAPLRETRCRRATELPASTEWVLIAGVYSRITVHLLAEEAGLLADLEPELVELLLSPYLGEQEARRLAIA